MSSNQGFTINEKGVLLQYDGTEETMIIPDGVKVIGKNMLGWNHGEHVKNVVVPEGVIEIKDEAFSGSKIEKITLPNSLKKLGKGVFRSCQNLKSVSFPDGISCVEEDLFGFSGIEEVKLPRGLQKINKQAFMHCRNLKKINLPLLDDVEIGAQAFTGCESLVDESGLLILQNRLFVHYQGRYGNFSVVLPDDLETIEPSAFSRYEKTNIQMNIKCPIWETSGTAKVYGFAESIVNADGSTICFRDDTGCIVAKVVLAIADETEPKKNGAILSVRQENGSFDFSGYDAYWAKLSKNTNKIRVALARLRYPFELSDEMRETYEAFLSKQSFNAGQLLIDEDNIDLLLMLSEKQLLTKNALPKLVDYANAQKKTEATAILLTTQHTPLQKTVTKKKEVKPKQREKIIWKKPKSGTHLIGRYLGTDTRVEFPLKIEDVYIDGIANTAGETPENYKSITDVVIPEGYTYIGNKAFAGCENLQTISLPASLREIGTQAFAGCTGLKEIIIRKDISFTGKNIFAGAKIGIVLIETEKKTKIVPHLFYGCDIQNLVIVGGPFKSNGNVFDYTGPLVEASYSKEKCEVNFPNAVYTNEDFTTLDLKGIGGASAKKIHSLAEFDETIILDSTAKDLVIREKSKAKKVVNNAKKVVESVNVETIDFANSIFVLSGFNFGEYGSITTEIEQRGGTVNYNVSAKMHYLVVPDRSVVKDTKIKKVIEFQEKGKPISIIKLKECRRHMCLYDIALFGKEGAEIANNYNLSLEDGKITINSYIGKEVDVIIPESIGPYPVVALKEKAFFSSYNNKRARIRSVVVPKTIAVLSKEVFGYCHELESVTLPDGLQIIDEYAFLNCEKLKSIIIPESVVQIKGNVFKGCTSLERINIPSTVEFISAPFTGCNSLKEIVVDEGNSKYDSRDNCNAVIETATNTLIAGCKTTVIPFNITKIGASAFAGLDSIKEFVIPEGIIEIENNAFNGCMELCSITLPESLVKIGHYGFHFCRELKKVILPNKLIEIGSNVFGNCQKLAEITIPDTLKTVDEFFLYNCRIRKVFGSKNSIAESIAKSWCAEYVNLK